MPDNYDFFKDNGLDIPPSLQPCPICGRPSRLFFNECTCEKDKVDKALQVGGALDWMTPASELTGIPLGCFIIVGVLLIAVIFVYMGQG